MRILIIYNKVPYPAKDGGSIAVLNIIKGFKELGHHVDLLSLNTSKHFVNASEIIKSKSSLNIEFVDININIKAFKLLSNLLFSKLPYNAVRFISNEFKQKLRNKIFKNNYDIIQIEGLYMLPYIATIRNITNTPVAYRAHNIEHEIWEKTFKLEKNILRKIYIKNLKKRIKRFEISYINTYNFLIPITKSDSNKFIQLGHNKKTFVCPTGVNINEYKSGNKTEYSVKLFFLGSLDWFPNIEGLLWFLENVWDPISKKHSHIRFAVAGRNASKTLVKKIKKYKNIDYYGEITDAKSYIQDHSVMIVPNRSGSGMRIKIIEAMACSKLIITTSAGLEGINAEEGTELLKADEPSEFISIIEQLNEGKIPILNIGKHAEQFISDKFDNFVITKGLIDFYKEQLNLN